MVQVVHGFQGFLAVVPLSKLPEAPPFCMYRPAVASNELRCWQANNFSILHWTYHDRMTNIYICRMATGLGCPC